MEFGYVDDIPILVVYVPENADTESVDGAGEYYVLDVKGVLYTPDKHPVLASFLSESTESAVDMSEKQVKEQWAIALGEFVRNVSTSQE